MNSLTKNSTLLSLDSEIPAQPLPPGATLPLTSNFPEIIDNTRRSSWTHCRQQFFRGHVQNLRTKGATNIHLHAGGCFARGLEVCRKAFYGEGLETDEAEALGRQAMLAFWGDFEVPEGKENKGLANLLKAFDSYFLEYPLATDRIKPLISANGEPAVEFTFSVPIPGTRHPTTGDPLLYAGRFDMLGLYNGQLFAVDEKTATSLGDQWRRQWDLDSQFTGYCWAAGQYGYKVAGAIVRGVGLLKTKISHAEAIVYRPQWMVDRWLSQLVRDCTRMTEAYKRWLALDNDSEWDYALDKAHCDAYSGCAYKLLCSTPEPDNWISSYEVSEWDPLAKV